MQFRETLRLSWFVVTTTSPFGSTWSHMPFACWITFAISILPCEVGVQRSVVSDAVCSNAGGPCTSSWSSARVFHTGRWQNRTSSYANNFYIRRPTCPLHLLPSSPTAAVSYLGPMVALKTLVRENAAHNISDLNHVWTRQQRRPTHHRQPSGHNFTQHIPTSSKNTAECVSKWPRRFQCCASPRTRQRRH